MSVVKPKQSNQFGQSQRSKGQRQPNEPIKIRSNYMLLTESARKRVRACHDWRWFTYDYIKKWRKFF